MPLVIETTCAFIGEFLIANCSLASIGNLVISTTSLPSPTAEPS